MRLTVTLLLVLTASASAQQAPVWEVLPDSPVQGYRSEDVFFVDNTYGWAVNGNGEIWRTTDGGTTWDRADTASGYFRATGFATPMKGWVGVLASSTRLYETLDGGETLTNITSRIQPSIPGGICGIWVVDENVVYAAGEYAGPAYVIKTTDGGASWTSMSLSAHLDTAVDVFFFDADHGFIIGGIGGLGGNSRARIIETTNGGATWTVRHTSNAVGGWGWKLTFPSDQVGYGSIEFGSNPGDAHIMKTTDGGQTWTDLTVPNGGNLQGIGFLTPNIGWTSGRGTTSVTTNGGATWQQIGLDGDINRFRFYNGIGYAAGHQIYRLDGTDVGVEPLPGVITSTLDAVAPNPSDGPVSIRYRLAVPTAVHVTITDVLGRTVATLAEGVQSAGPHTITWAPDGLAGGVYVVQFRAGWVVQTRAVTVLGR